MMGYHEKNSWPNGPLRADGDLKDRPNMVNNSVVGYRAESLGPSIKMKLFACVYMPCVSVNGWITSCK